jgi:ABC-2 type transport system ATP-binding protein
VPAGRVTGLVGPNGAAKTTLLQLAAGLLTPTSGAITVLGERPGGSPAQLAGLGFVAQDAPVYPGLSVAGWPAPHQNRRASAAAIARSSPAEPAICA